jgi:hypothetical protein
MYQSLHLWSYTVINISKLSLHSSISWEHKRRLARVFNFKLGCFVISKTAWQTQARPHLELKTRPRFYPIKLKFVHAISYHIGQCLLAHAYNKRSLGLHCKTFYSHNLSQASVLALSFTLTLV